MLRVKNFFKKINKRKKLLENTRVYGLRDLACGSMDHGSIMFWDLYCYLLIKEREKIT